jgi:hypothetical protein
MSPAFTFHHGQNIAGNALCAGRGATIFVSSVFASLCASHKVALRRGISHVVEVFLLPLSLEFYECFVVLDVFFIFFFSSFQNFLCTKST